MSFLLHDSLNELESAEITMSGRPSIGKQRISPRGQVTVFKEKLRVPVVGKVISRPRLSDLLDRSITQYGATLISGRAGTGKTTLAADYVRRAKRSSWLTVGPADSDWTEFAVAFWASLFGPGNFGYPSTIEATDAGISEFLIKVLGKLAKRKRKTPHLIVIDNVHYLFDTEWFAEFFRQLILSLDQNARLLMLCRSKPNAPLWRLRSKQMLNVIDENLLDLSESEAIEIGGSRGVTSEHSLAALRRSYGRLATFLKYLAEHAD